MSQTVPDQATHRYFGIWIQLTANSTETVSSVSSSCYKVIQSHSFTVRQSQTCKDLTSQQSDKYTEWFS